MKGENENEYEYVNGRTSSGDVALQRDELCDGKLARRAGARRPQATPSRPLLPLSPSTLLPSLLALLALLASPLSAQFGAADPFSTQQKGTDPNASLLSRDAVPVARTVEPALYVMGAGDLVALALTQPLNVESVLPVSADGHLVVPKLGAVRVAGLTLAAAKDAVFAALQKKFSIVDGSMSLAQPRAIIVRVTGAVKSPGLLQVTAATPVSVAVELADAEKQESTMSPLAQLQGQTGSSAPSYRERLGSRYFGAMERETRALRRIVVQHADGSVSRADLTLYEATRDGRLDPLLREGDVIVVPQREIGAPTVAVLGAVQRPGVFEYKPGDRVADLLRMGFGLDPLKTATAAELVSASGAKKKIDLSAVAGDDTPLQPGDRLFVYAESPRADGGAAAADGMLAKPGVYPIEPGRTTLTQLVEMAGRFPEDARERDRNFAKSPLSMEDTLYWSLSSRLREGRVAVDFRRLFAQGDRTADVTLEDGDILLVPRNTRTVYVWGQLRNSGFIPWTAGKDYHWYVAQAGGLGESADESRAAVIKGGTRAWVDPDDATIEPGDQIHVPHEPLVRIASTSEILAVAAAIVGGLAGVAGLVISVLR